MGLYEDNCITTRIVGSRNATSEISENV